MHIASRPDWNCRECGTEWPCGTAKKEITAEYAHDRIAMCIYLATLMCEAIDDLIDTGDEPPGPPDLYRRFLRWPDQITEAEATTRLSTYPDEP